ncbi:bifunctional glycosyltransferase family 2 protein/class I SAM-dependent methyltransferase [Paenibacillus alvei]|uniref:bifunctional glycosyltransferase family 2 protein/class I SAM-dependent methyltransferase n=1 Tax=Paenibacillus alvei TaxID=44250 RepID=UPI00227F4099|nr:bifunctional glycosyltransferase family 2 protein/class I SAM-dependent methyltransferase [Paenibacillus alvei]
MLTSIVILTHNKLDYTIQCIESIRRYTRPNTYEIIVVDNQSTDETVPWLSAQPDIRAIFNEQNEGFPKGCNQGIEISNGDYILLLNNDVIVTENWLENLMACITSDESIGAVSCITNHCSYGQMIPVPYTSVESMHVFAKEHNCSNRNEWEERLKLVGFCMLIRKSVVEKIGLLDERFTPGNYEDDDYSLRIRKAGYKLILCKDTFIHHFGSVSFKENTAFQKLLKRNAGLYESKWGFDPDHSQLIQNDLVSHINCDAEANINVLEIGCGSGGTLLAIKNNFKNSALFGVETNPAEAEVASLIANVRVVDMYDRYLDLELDYPVETFDYIIISDVLAKLYAPEAFIRKLKLYLKPVGKLLVKTRNVLHHLVVEQLVQGSWYYSGIDALKNPYIRFFTLQDIKTMLSNSGYKEEMVVGLKGRESVEDRLFIEKLSLVGNPQFLEQTESKYYIVQAGKDILDDLITEIDANRDNKEHNIHVLQPYSTERIISAILAKHVAKPVELLNYLAVTHFEQGFYDKVIPFLESALQLSPDDIEVLYNMTYVLYFLGEQHVSVTYADKLKRLDEAAFTELLELFVTPSHSK